MTLQPVAQHADVQALHVIYSIVLLSTCDVFRRSQGRRHNGVAALQGDSCVRRRIRIFAVALLFTRAACSLRLQPPPVCIHRPAASAVYSPMHRGLLSHTFRSVGISFLPLRTSLRAVLVYPATPSTILAAAALLLVPSPMSEFKTRDAIVRTRATLNASYVMLASSRGHQKAAASARDSVEDIDRYILSVLQYMAVAMNDANEVMEFASESDLDEWDEACLDAGRTAAECVAASADFMLSLEKLNISGSTQRTVSDIRHLAPLLIKAADASAAGAPAARIVLNSPLPINLQDHPNSPTLDTLLDDTDTELSLFFERALTLDPVVEAVPFVPPVWLTMTTPVHAEGDARWPHVECITPAVSPSPSSTPAQIHIKQAASSADTIIDVCARAKEMTRANGYWADRDVLLRTVCFRNLHRSALHLITPILMHIIRVHTHHGVKSQMSNFAPWGWLQEYDRMIGTKPVVSLEVGRRLTDNMATMHAYPWSRLVLFSDVFRLALLKPQRKPRQVPMPRMAQSMYIARAVKAALIAVVPRASHKRPFEVYAHSHRMPNESRHELTKKQSSYRRECGPDMTVCSTHAVREAHAALVTKLSIKSAAMRATANRQRKMHNRQQPAIPDVRSITRMPMRKRMCIDTDTVSNESTIVIATAAELGMISAAKRAPVSFCH